jgi:hypothetical protein
MNSPAASLSPNYLRSRIGKICVAIIGNDAAELLLRAEEVYREARFLEFRLDYLAKPLAALPRLKTFLAEHPEVTAIATCRREANGGKFAGTNAAELDVLQKAASSGFHLVDVELQTAEQVKSGRSWTSFAATRAGADSVVPRFRGHQGPGRHLRADSPATSRSSSRSSPPRGSSGRQRGHDSLSGSSAKTRPTWSVSAWESRASSAASWARAPAASFTFASVDGRRGDRARPDFRSELCSISTASTSSTCRHQGLWRGRAIPVAHFAFARHAQRGVSPGKSQFRLPPAADIGHERPV